MTNNKIIWLKLFVSITKLRTLTQFLIFCGLALSAQDLRVGVETQDAYLNEPFLFQIQVDSEQQANAPRLPAFPGFRVAPQPPQHSHSSRLSIVNGRRTQSVTVTTTFSYLLTPLQLGKLNIPALEVMVNGQVKRTQPISITVREPEKIEGIVLQAQLSGSEAYIGEPLMLTWRWYIDRQIYNYSFNLPVLQRPEFSFPDYRPPIDRARQRQYQGINNQQGAELIALQSNVRFQGKNCSVLVFERPLIPLQAGDYNLPESSAICEIEDLRSGRTQQSRRLSPFDDFESFFSGSRRPTRKISVVAPPLQLRVKPLPSAGQPANFSGIVGQCRIEVSAEPREVNVGDPMVLSIVLSGPPYLDHIKLPPLESLPALAANFKISAQEPGIVQDGAKLFQCTLRANGAGINEIPALEIPYFNSAKGSYDFAVSKPIPIKVEQIHSLTVQDAVGGTVLESISPRELQLSEVGIAHNYEPAAILAAGNQVPGARLSSASTLVGLLLPPGAWALLAAATLWRRRREANPGARLAAKAAAKNLSRLRRMQTDKPEALEELSEILQDYLRQRLQLEPGIVTYADLQHILSARGLSKEDCLPFKQILADCEAGRFAGATTLSLPKLREQMKLAIKGLEAVL